MENDKKTQAKDLYLQTGLNKTQIAEVLGVSRRSVHYWIKAENWQRLKMAAEHLPSLVVEDCYYLLSQFVRDCMSNYRMTKPLTREEADTIYKLTLCIQKLKNRSTLNESMEMFALLQDGIRKQNPEVAKALNPYIEKYLSTRANVYMCDIQPDTFTSAGYLAYQGEPDIREQQQDICDMHDWENEVATLGYVPESREPQEQNNEGAKRNV